MSLIDRKHGFDKGRRTAMDTVHTLWINQTANYEDEDGSTCEADYAAGLEAFYYTVSRLKEEDE